MTKLIIQIPCLNEAATLPQTLADLPTVVPGIDTIETLVVDDGSRDGTADVARACGVDHVVRLRRNKGLAAAFAAGIDASLKQGADFIVNTDADNQYAAQDIPRLLQPLLNGEADIVIGDRNIAELADMSRRNVAPAAGELGRATGVQHECPGYHQRVRAHARGGAPHDNRFGFSHTGVDHQAGKKRMAIAHVPVSTNLRTRESRLFDSLFSYQAIRCDNRPHLCDVSRSRCSRHRSDNIWDGSGGRSSLPLLPRLRQSRHRDTFSR